MSRPEFDRFFESEFVPLRRFALVLTGSLSSADALALLAMVRVRRGWRHIRAEEDPAIAARRELASLFLSPWRFRLRATSQLPGSGRRKVALALAAAERRSEWEISQVLDCAPSVTSGLVRGSAGIRVDVPDRAEPAADDPGVRFIARRRISAELRACAFAMALVLAGVGAAAAKSSAHSRTSWLLPLAQRVPGAWRSYIWSLAGLRVGFPRTWRIDDRGDGLVLSPRDARNDFAVVLAVADGPFDEMGWTNRGSVGQWAYTADAAGRSYAFPLGRGSHVSARIAGRGALGREQRSIAVRVLSTLRRQGGQRTYSSSLYRVVVPEEWIGREFPMSSGALDADSSRVVLMPAETTARTPPDQLVSSIAENGLAPWGWFAVEIRAVVCRACSITLRHDDFPDGTTTDGKPYRRHPTSARHVYSIRFEIDWDRVTLSPSCAVECVPRSFVYLEATIAGTADVFDRFVDAGESIIASIRDAMVVDRPVPGPSGPSLFLS